MENKILALERERKEMLLAAMVWCLAVWYASDEGKAEVPSQHEWLSSELVAALVEDGTGEKFWYSWRHDRFGKEHHYQWDEWPNGLNVALGMAIWEVEGSIDTLLLRLLGKFVQYRPQRDMDERWYDSELKLFIVSSMSIPQSRALFVPSRDMAAKSIQAIGAEGVALYAGAMSLCLRIGSLMRPYIKRDIAYIKKYCL